jgi:hypothetical protein
MQIYVDKVGRLWHPVLANEEEMMILTAKQAATGKAKLNSAYMAVSKSGVAKEDRREFLNIILECERLISVERFTGKRVG